MSKIFITPKEVKNRVEEIPLDVMEQVNELLNSYSPGGKALYISRQLLSPTVLRELNSSGWVVFDAGLNTHVELRPQTSTLFSPPTFIGAFSLAFFALYSVSTWTHHPILMGIIGVLYFFLRLISKY